MFGFFSRKQQPSAKVSNLQSEPMAVDSAPQQLRTPSPSEAAFNGLGSHPNVTMAPLRPSASDASKQAVPPTPEALHSLVTSIPPKTLHTYVLDHIPAAPPDTLATLSSFFATLSPPPLLHCVRCHADYTDVENGDRSCRVPHDDDSAEVEWVGRSGRDGCEYETFYGCCSKTVDGEGDLGPPDGWCYEGMHTTDTRRARFRADATHDDDKLDSCLWLNCHNIRARLPTKKAGAGASTSGRAKRARPPLDEAEGDDEDGGTDGTGDTGIAEIARGVGALDPAPKSKGKSKGKAPATAKPKAEMMTTATSASTPKRGRGGPRRTKSGPVRKSRPRQESDGESSKADSVKAPAIVAVTPASRRRRRSDAKPRSTASASPGKTTSPPSSPNARGRKPLSKSKMDSVEIIMTRSRSRTRSRVRGSGAETGDEKTEGRLRKRRKVAQGATA